METAGQIARSMIIIDNDTLIKNKSMIINDNDRADVENSRKRKVRQTEYIANTLVTRFNAPNSRNFFLKCAWRLPEQFIWSAYEATKREDIKSPIKYFVRACSNEMSKN